MILWLKRSEPTIYQHDNTFGSCNDLEMYTKWIFQDGLHKAILIEYKGQIFGHIKLSGYKTFLGYQDQAFWVIQKWWVFNVNRKFEEYLEEKKDKGRMEFNDVWLTKAQLQDDDLLWLYLSRSIDLDDYRTVIKESLSGRLNRDERLLINDDFDLDLEQFQQKIKTMKIPIANIPFKKLHLIKTFFSYVWLQKPKLVDHAYSE